MTKCRKQTGCHHDKTDKTCCDDCRKKKVACSKACEGECKLNLCDTCKNDIETCYCMLLVDVKFGEGVGNDNVIECKHYLKVEGEKDEARNPRTSRIEEEV